MTISLKHSFTNPKADGGDTTIVRPSDWNAEHVLQQATSTILGRITAGTGATEELTGSNVRTITGLATSDSPEFAAINLGHATDTTITRASPGVIAVEGSNVLMASNIGSTVQGYDADLNSWAGVTRASGFDTFVATPSSDNFRTLVTGETGTGGGVVFATGPTITNLTLTGAATEDVYTITDAAGFAIDPTNGSFQQVTLGASRTPTQANWTSGQSVVLKVADGTAYTITWTTIGVTWLGGSAPTLATTGWTFIALWKDGSTVYGYHMGDSA